MQFETVEPINGRFAALGHVSKDLVRSNSAVVTNRNWQRVNEGDTSGFASASLQVKAQRHERRRHQLDEAVVADEVWEFIAQMPTDFLEVEDFEGAIARELKPDDDSHDFAEN